MHAPFFANPRIPASLSALLPAAFPQDATGSINSTSARSFSVRVRAQTAVSLLGDPANVVLVSAATKDRLASGCPADFQPKPGQIPKPIPAGNLTITLVPSLPPSATSSTSLQSAVLPSALPAKSLRFSFTAPTQAGMGCARATFQSPLNLTAHRPLGLLVHGDGSGALMNLQQVEHSSYKTIKMAHHLDLRCVLVPAPWVPGQKHVLNPA